MTIEDNRVLKYSFRMPKLFKYYVSFIEFSKNLVEFLTNC